MSCAADEPGTERGRTAAARGSAATPGRGRGAPGPLRSAWLDCSRRRGSGQRGAPSRSAAGRRPREPAAEPELTGPPARISPSPAPRRGPGSPQVRPPPAPLGKLMLKEPERVSGRGGDSSDRGGRAAPATEGNYLGAGRRAPRNVKLRRLGSGES